MPWWVLTSSEPRWPSQALRGLCWHTSFHSHCNPLFCPDTPTHWMCHLSFLPLSLGIFPSCKEMPLPTFCSHFLLLIFKSQPTSQGELITPLLCEALFDSFNSWWALLPFKSSSWSYGWPWDSCQPMFLESQAWCYRSQLILKTDSKSSYHCPIVSWGN